MFFLWPVEKLSKPMTFWLSFRRFSRRLEPMKPATPVISQVDCLDLRLSFKVSYWDMVTGKLAVRNSRASYRIVQDVLID